MPTNSARSIKSSYTSLHAVIQQLDQLHLLTDACKNALTEHTFELTVSQGQYLMKRGDYCTHIYFIIEGFFSGWATGNGRSITSFIAIQGDFLSAIEGMYGITECTEDVKAEEDSVLLALPVEHLIRYFDIYPEMNIVMRKVLENYYKMAHQRSVFFRIGTASDKYLYLLSTYGDYASRIPLHVIASFINVKLNTLQKIIKQYEGKSAHVQLSKGDIVTYMEQERPFLQKKLSINQLSLKLKITPHLLSYLLNVYFKQNFNHFVNTYRIQYVLNQFLIKNSIKQYSLDGLGSESGFSSRSSFFSEFKKYTGVTPLLYLKMNCAS
ncbi:Crp/Fnr family transcriptional regulator [Pedobacter cryoconitis]|uniref:Crp/Fnr family transcriptional regulator n=1 Tax=Pedobacter cryoconitis TaxID=188932 RepID=UPI001621166D|nr:Crp/Fnr family transcriptional regulator [Pedobacter cryoconitis]MBB5644648.1 CRP-like cAMP-binding protein [Pedobacter cryoconitis]